MKILKTLWLLLLTTGAVLAQPNPDDFFISGYVVDANGNAQANHTVCVEWISNNPVLPSDSMCTTTNANGYYYFTVTNGSVSGPNIDYDVYTDDPCSFLPLVQTLSNGQGSIDIATADFVLCANSISCDVSITASNDSTNGPNGLWTFTANPTGTAPFSYDWWVDGTTYTTQTVTHTFNGGIVGVYVTVTDANGCDAMEGDTLYLDGNQNNCTAEIQASVNPNGGTTLTAGGTGVAPLSYSWSTGEVTSSISVTQPGVYCLTVSDATGCTVTTCDTVGSTNPGCSVEITTIVDSTGVGLVYTLTASGGFSQYVWSNNQVGQTITLQNVSPNGEVVCVSATDNNGCNATACDTLLPVSGNGPCEAGFLYPAGPNGEMIIGDTVQLWFDGVASNSSDFLWTISAGGFQFTATGMNPIFTLPPTLVPVNGVMVEICVTVNDQLNNCSDTYCQNVLAVPDSNTTSCTAAFSWAESTILGSPLPAIEFTDLSSNAAQWYWDFGDNTFSSDQNPIHAYNGTGTYTVCLTIVSADQSCQNTYCSTVTVGSPNGNCDASFSNSGPTPIGYTFSATAQNPNLYYYWEIDNAYVGDGYEAYAPGFTNGVHTICLTIVDSLSGCLDTQCQTITVGGNNCYGYISGQVYAGTNNNPLDAGIVYLITFDANSNQLTAVDSMPVDSGNYYFFGPLACGDYLIKAAAGVNSQYYSNHIPTYYGNSPFWGFAQTVSLGQANQQITADVTLIAANNPGGPGFIGGDVTQGANKMDPGDPLAGMQVMIFDLSGNAITYGYTDVNGEFGFSDLAYGTYQVYVEVLGVQTIPAVVTIGPDNPSEENVHIFASETLISTGIEEFDFEGAVSNVYPNPVSDNVFINLNFENELSVNVSILDLTGRTISTEVFNVAGGENTVNISADNLKGGYYFLNIQDTDKHFSVTRRFMRID